MTDKPGRATSYNNDHLETVQATCLYLATKLGDMLDDVVIVGGLVPSLLINTVSSKSGTEPHVGTMDLDVGLSLALLKEYRYQEFAERLRGAGLAPDVNQSGNATRQRWRLNGPKSLTVDFLIPAHDGSRKAGTLQNIESDFAAIVTPGLELAFQDRCRITLSGKTAFGEKATRDIWVCGPGAFVVLKALAFQGRGANKDAYDLFYVVSNYGDGVGDVAIRVKGLLDAPEAMAALAILRNDFLDLDAIGPKRVAEFMRGASDEDLQADVALFIKELLRLIDQ